MDRTATIEKVTQALLGAKPAMMAAYGSRRCIVRTRIAVDACRAARLRAVPVPVEVNITMPSGSEAHMGFDPPEVERPGDWNGHLVAAVENRSLLDLTLDSMRAPTTPRSTHSLPPGDRQLSAPH